MEKHSIVVGNPLFKNSPPPYDERGPVQTYSMIDDLIENREKVEGRTLSDDEIKEFCKRINIDPRHVSRLNPKKKIAPGSNPNNVNLKRRKQAMLTTVSDIQSLARQQGVNLSYDEAKEISMKIDIARSVDVFNEEQPALFAQKMLREHGINIHKKRLSEQWVYTICMIIFLIIVGIIGTLLGY